MCVAFLIPPPVQLEFLQGGKPLVSLAGLGSHHHDHMEQLLPPHAVLVRAETEAEGPRDSGSVLQDVMAVVKRQDQQQQHATTAATPRGSSGSAASGSSSSLMKQYAFRSGSEGGAVIELVLDYSRPSQVEEVVKVGGHHSRLAGCLTTADDRLAACGCVAGWWSGGGCLVGWLVGWLVGCRAAPPGVARHAVGQAAYRKAAAAAATAAPG